MKALKLALLSLWILSPAGRARDINPQNYFIGERAAGMGGAFVALSGDLASSYYNPAGLAGMLKQGLSMSASAYQLAVEEYPGAIHLNLSDGSLNENLKSVVFATFPSSVAYLLPLDRNEAGSGLHQVLSLSLFVPDFDKLDAEIKRIESSSSFELKGSLWRQDLTYWFGPSYALSFGKRLRLGISVFGLAHMMERRMSLGAKHVKTSEGGQTNLYVASAEETNAYAFSLLIQGGVQVLLDDRFSLGLSIRSPTLGTIYSHVRMLALTSVYAEDDTGTPILDPKGLNYVDRIETEEVEMNYRIPLSAAIGVGYQVEGTLCFGLDLSVRFPQSSYAFLEGPKVYPKDPQGADIVSDDRALYPTELLQDTWVFNFNLGGEINLSPAWLLRFGLFSDFSTVDQDYYGASKELRLAALTLPQLMRFGGSIGLGMAGERTTTFLGLVYAYGKGSTFSLNEIFVEEVSRIDVVAHTLTVVVAGSANF